ncbi:uncharacterized protein LACBIDRAFT_336159 [Laccaria bicolor S238N-H82]|uniref:Predicted protein n=1 Tax=Laccaria bicolor (strain S238N-H82 / ATCC MYA-4686) TaxID=486041 RepID=B0E4K5_LACBS|nr:uncharacterized protein LACBIDRAFT_336159 [Laccaria bicolor S238N-H82]EDQ98226.1 predicted protein [Laccaria bicolor S238N-H82]|eukprot:XP_001891123.1 predicted protein [Laccaria bicolor S238N-H82]
MTTWHHTHQHQHQQQYENATVYENPTLAYRTHNIFDVSASSASSTASSAFPTHFSSSSATTANNGAGSQSSSLHDAYQQHPFDSTLPAINSGMRYDPPSPSSPPLPPSSTTNLPPSSFHSAHAHLTRHTCSPASRSRPRSCPPSSSSAPFPPSSAANGSGDTQAVNLISLPLTILSPLKIKLKVKHNKSSSPPPSSGAAPPQQQQGQELGQQQAVGDKQALLANENRRRRRRESHNAVERRRRGNINEKIMYVGCWRKDSLGEEAGGGGGQQGGDGGVVKANKGMILRKSVEYIRYLQQLVTAQGACNRELEQELKAYRRRSRSSSSMEPPLSDSASTAAGGDGSNMILHDELHHFHHGGHGHMGRLPSMPEEGGDDGDDLRLTISKANLSSSLMELKAVGIATFLMAVGAVTVMWNAQEFGEKIIYRPAATDEDYLDAYEVVPFEVEGWTWVEAEKRLMMRWVFVLASLCTLRRIIRAADELSLLLMSIFIAIAKHCTRKY